MNKTEFPNNKIITLQAATYLSNIWKKFNKKLVFTNGCFDILHEGHIDTLSKAASYGDILIVGLNSDLSVQKLKGNDRPINAQNSRALILASLIFVDYVIIFEEETPFLLISTLLPNVLVKGGDYSKEQIVGAKEVIENGGEVIINETKVGFSTTNIINKMKTI